MIRWLSYKLYLHRLYFFTYALLFLAGSLLVMFYGSKPLFLWINHHWVSPLGKLAYWVTMMGEGTFFAILTLLAALRCTRWGVDLLLAHGFASLISSFFKHILFKGAPRPRSVFPEGTLQLVDGVDVHYWNSFPSGHTITAFCIFTVLVLVLGRPALDWLWLMFALGVGLSRIILSQHFPEDVLVGSLIGVLSALIALYYTSKIKTSWIDKPLARLINRS